MANSNWIEKTKRLLEGQSLRAVEKAAGWTTNSLAGTMNQKSVPSATKGVALARALDVSADWLFDDDQDWPPPEPPDEFGLTADELNALVQTVFNGAAQLLAAAVEHEQLLDQSKSAGKKKTKKKR
ncbi:MAG: helix-turn-helix domain-containing protein [Phycisphaerales bacterium]|nr:helix-turn-helix domain-containing protein [Phycisphaerales bacterium]